MAVTIDFSNEKRTGAYVYNDGTYTINGGSSANLADNVLESAHGSIRKGEDYLGDFHANKMGDTMRVSINGVDASLLAVVSPVVTACLDKIKAHYA